MRLGQHCLVVAAMLGMTAAAAQAESPLAQKIADTGKVVIGYANEAPSASPPRTGR
jgi:hypothetical protein